MPPGRLNDDFAATRMKAALVGLGASLAAIAIALRAGSRHRQRSITRLVESLVDSSMDLGAAQLDASDRAELPAPVAAYFAHVLRKDQPAIRLARFRQAGELRTEASGTRWLRFDADAVVSPLAVGFVWEARVAMAPLLHLRVRDALVGGAGSGRVDLLSAFPVASAEGDPRLTSGALHRYLAEGVWYPTALLPRPGLRWSAVDAHAAVATLTHSGVTVSLEFRFDAAAEVAGIYTPARWGRFGGSYRQAPWEGHFRNYVHRYGMLVPSEGDVGWYVERRWRSVWRAKVLEAAYDWVR